MKQYYMVRGDFDTGNVKEIKKEAELEKKKQFRRDNERFKL